MSPGVVTPDGADAGPIVADEHTAVSVNTSSGEGDTQQTGHEAVKDKSKHISATTTLRPTIPVDVVSSAGRYLDDSVWPTLGPALERLLNAVKYNTPFEVREKYDGGYNGHEVKRVLHPEDTKDFDPILWLGEFLKNHNPNVPPKYSPDEAATILQCSFRSRKARKALSDLKANRDSTIQALAEEKRRNEAATAIQAAYRGHKVRLAMALGQRGDFAMC